MAAYVARNPRYEGLCAHVEEAWAQYMAIECDRLRPQASAPDRPESAT